MTNSGRGNLSFSKKSTAYIDSRDRVFNTGGNPINRITKQSLSEESKSESEKQNKSMEESDTSEESKSSITMAEDLSEDSEQGNSVEELPWIEWFCSQPGNEMFVQVDLDYVQDGFNLTGLESFVKNYDAAIDIITDVDTTEEDWDAAQRSSIETEAENLYGLIHARFIITNRGLQAMHEKFSRGMFGKCPRVFCNGNKVLPVGTSDSPYQDTVKMYCCACEEIYSYNAYVPDQKLNNALDGAFFGTTFAHLFFLTYPELKLEAQKSIKRNLKYEAKVFGFKISKTAYKRSFEAMKLTQQKEAARAKQAQENERRLQNAKMTEGNRSVRQRVS